MTDLDLVRILMSSRSLLRSAAFFNFFSIEGGLAFNTGNIAHPFWGNFQYSVCFLFSVTDLDWVGEHSGAVPVPAESRRIFQPEENNRNFAFSNRNGTMENVHFEMEAQQKNICIFKSNPSCRDLR